MPGDPWQRFANLRALYGWMWGHPGKKLVFMGGEIAQYDEWNHDKSVDWHLAEHEPHRGMQTLMGDLNRLYREQPALFEVDSGPSGFQWIQADSGDASVYAFVRRSGDGKRHVLCVANLTPVVRHSYRIGCPQPGLYRELLNTDAAQYGGSGVGNHGQVEAKPHPWDGQPASMELTLPPLAVVWLAP
jgi:1,4-alpha-glucan branching enzyme